MRSLISVGEADQVLRGLVRQTSSERCALAAACGRVLREPVEADRDLPPFDRVMMDGYAARYDELGSSVRLKVLGSVLAGDPEVCFPEGFGSVLEVATGGVLPRGADVVVPVEDVLLEGGHIRLVGGSDIVRGQYIHRRGSDYPKVRQLVQSGSFIRSVEVGVLASCGYGEVRVGRRPIVSVFGTGDELVGVGEEPLAHQLRGSNLHVLETLLTRCGAAVHRVEHLPDQDMESPERLRASLSDSDLVVVSGAISKGRLDWVPGVLNEGCRCLFHGVSQRPGKPMGVWQSGGGCVVFALPGNPVSTLTCGLRYLLPFALAMLGCSVVPETRLMGESFRFEKALSLFLPVKCLSDGTCLPRPVRNSGDYAGLVATDGFIELAAEANFWTAGDRVPFFAWR